MHQLTRWMVDSGAGWVLWVLLALSVASVAIAIERALVFRRVHSDVQALVPQLRGLLREDDLERARQLLSGSESVASAVARAGLAELAFGAGAAEKAMAAALGLERARLERRLLFLATVGNNAPFVGLLGTVIGVVGAFDALAASNALATAAALAPERVMSTIGEALVATAVGLLVAIPAVAAYNYFSARVSASIAAAETLANVVLAHANGRANGRESSTSTRRLRAGAAE